MKQPCLIFIISVTLLLAGMTSCNDGGKQEKTVQAAAENESHRIVTDGSNTTVRQDSFLPGEVLVTIPLYPGSEPTTFLDWQSEGGPPSVTCNNPVYNGPRRPGYQSASVQYTADATAKEIYSWYKDELTSMGYETDGRGEGGNRKLSTYYGAFYLPSQPSVSVEIHAYQILVGSGPNMVYELLVVNSVPLPKPDNAVLPSDIDSIELTWYGQYGDPEINRTITEMQDIVPVVEIVNELIVKPDYSFSGMSGPVNEITYRMVFHSASFGDIVLESITNRGDENGIHVDGCLILWDAQNSLYLKVKELSK